MKKIRKLLVLICTLSISAAMLAACSTDEPDLYKPDTDSIDVSADDFTDIHQFKAVDDEGHGYTQDVLKDADVTVINVWSIGCQPCINEMPDLAEYRRSLPDNVQMYLLCVDGDLDPDTMHAILDEAGYDGVNWVSGSGDIADFIAEVRYVPTTVFVDGEGNIIGEPLIGASPDLESRYNEYINQALRVLGKKEMA